MSLIKYTSAYTFNNYDIDYTGRNTSGVIYLLEKKYKNGEIIREKIYVEK